MSFFKKKDEPKKSGIKPKLRPAGFNPSNSGSDPQEKSGTSGKGGGEATPTYDTSAPDWNKKVTSFNKKGGKNNDGRFGYGYVDTQTGIEVPWYIDMINGGGANAAGDTFVSPFENARMGGGMMGIGSQAISGGLNAMGVAPYGSNRARYFMPMEAARVDASGAPVRVDLGPASTVGNNAGGNAPANLLGIPNSMTDDDMGLPTGPAVTSKTSEQAIGGYQYPSMYRGMDRQVGLFNEGQNSVSPMLPVGAADGDAELARLNRNRQSAMSPPIPQPDIDPAMLGNDVNTSIIVNQNSRLDLAKTVPYKWLNTSYDQMYKNFLAKGGTVPFEAWLKGDR